MDFANFCPFFRYPITRDCFIYGITVIILSLVLIDESVFWWEALVMVIFYGGYIILMAFNVKIEGWAHSVVKNVKKRVYPAANGSSNNDNNTNNLAMTMPNESTPLHSASKSTQVNIEAPPLSLAQGIFDDEKSKYNSKIMNYSSK